MKKVKIIETLFLNYHELGEEASYKDGKLLAQPKALFKAILLLPHELQDPKLIDELKISITQDFISISDGRQKLIGCPRCLKIEPISTKNWSVRFEEVVIRNPEEHIYTLHSCGFETSDFLAEEFKVTVLDGITIEYGTYWELNRHKLQKLAEANGLQVK